MPGRIIYVAIAFRLKPVDTDSKHWRSLLRAMCHCKWSSFQLEYHGGCVKSAASSTSWTVLHPY